MNKKLLAHDISYEIRETGDGSGIKAIIFKLIVHGDLDYWTDRYFYVQYSFNPFDDPDYADMYVYTIIQQIKRADIRLVDPDKVFSKIKKGVLEILVSKEVKSRVVKNAILELVV